ncbi:MAG: IS1595 family transposase [Caldilineaceae bacterium SB0662_bin_9]|uniref:IS1595 family transposase n=1 Tax=Caldilineaceae bacterium SB0662_bin_9 TaxID=2605258 RepID=A0A6B1DXE8_9CHLR|nr:IS1595 family transposase [Caldilineaceae bacterium SB0662_bin_9]
MKLHREPNINQRSICLPTHRLRVAWAEQGQGFSGPVEVDETYFGGRCKNMSNARCNEQVRTGRGAIDKVAVVGAKDRDGHPVAATVVENADAPTLQGQGVVRKLADDETTAYIDAHRAYETLLFDPEVAKYTLSEYAKGNVYTNGFEPLWSTSKRAYQEPFNKLLPKHLHRNVQERLGSYGLDDLDTIEFMTAVAMSMKEEQFRYCELIAENRSSSEKPSQVPNQL